MCTIIYFIVSTSLTKEENISHIINVAGSERMLTEKINKKAIQLVYLEDSVAKDQIITASKKFEENLYGLMYGNDYLERLDIKDEKIITQLKSVEKQWQSLKIDIEQIISGQGNDILTIQRVNAKSEELIRLLEILVKMIENKGEQSFSRKTTDNIILLLLNVFLVIVLIFIWRLFNKLSKSDKRYQLLTDYSPFGMMILNEDKIQFINQFGLRILGINNEKDIIGKPVYTLISPEYQPFVNTRLNHVLENKQVTKLLEEEWVKRDGEKVHMEVIAMPFDNMGEKTSLTIFHDISEQKRTEKQVKHISKELNDIKLALDMASIVEITNNKGVILYVNDKFCEISQYRPEEVVGKTLRIINSGYHPREFFKNLWDTVLRGEVWEGEVRNKAKDGSFYWVQTLIVPFLNSQGKPYQFITIRNDITARKKAEQEIRFLATHDHLTHLYNRRIFELKLQQSIDRDERVAVFFLDLDRFKYINDSLGHSDGDRLIQLVAKRLIEIIGTQAIISRQGGDEFTILFKYENKESIFNLAQTLVDGIKQPFYIDHREILTTCSIGISMYPQHGNDIETLIKNADIAMYWAKENGKDDYSLYQDHMKEKSDKIMHLELELRKAIDHKELLLHYQPKMDLGTKEIVGCEALIRWQHPIMGMISPADFIPLAEETGLINEIGQWVLREACLQNKKWHDEGHSDFVVAVNMSVHQFKQSNVIEMIENVLLETKLEARYLELEITESISMLNEKNIINKLHSLKDLGISLAIDDFGTGYSSLQYLDKLPVDTLKIDRSFIKRIGEYENFQTSLMTNAIISLAHSLNMKVVAEGIETYEQLNHLKNIACEVGQGYYISKPLPAFELREFLEATHVKC